MIFSECWALTSLSKYKMLCMNLRTCKIHWLCCLLLLLVSVFAKAQPQYKQHGEVVKPYNVYALKVGTLKSKDVTIMFWLVEGYGKKILVDAGFYNLKNETGRFAKKYTSPEKLLGKLDIKPAEITDIIITNFELINVAGAASFPNAKIWLQKDAYDYYLANSNASVTFINNDFLAILKKNAKEKLQMVIGDDQEIMPGISCYTLATKNTVGSQFVSVAINKGTVVLASNEAGWLKKEEVKNEMRSIASKEQLILLNNDISVFKRFTKVSSKIAAIKAMDN